MPPPTTDPVLTEPRSVGEVLSVSAAHLRGLHDSPREDCWRCRRAAEPELAAAPEPAEPIPAET